MKVIGINGSPRKNQNSYKMLKSCLDGFASIGYETKTYHLKDIKFNGCISCFACKVKNSTNLGRCAFRDNLHHVIDEIVDEADVLVISTPIYFGDVTGMVRNFTERLLFPNCLYRKDGSTSYPKRIKVIILYTMNVQDEGYYTNMINSFNATYNRFLGDTVSLCATDTYQYANYKMYESEIFDEEAKKKSKNEKFPVDLKKAYDLAVKIGQE